MGSGRLGEILKLDEEVIKRSCSLSFQKFPDNQLFHGKSSTTHVFFSFPGSWSVESWISGNSVFGETDIKPAKLFPSMKSIGNHDPNAKPGSKDFAIAFVNQAFLHKFEQVLLSSQLEEEVKKANEAGKTIIFTGHSAGGATAMFAAIWFLEKYRKAKRPFCLTFGSPLIGDHILSHALKRENWSQYFIHFVMRYDIVPRVSLAPLSEIKQQFEKVLPFFNPNSTEYKGRAPEALDFYTNVMANAASVTGSAASKLVGNGNLLLQTVSNFIKLSPYRPFGTYIFCTGNGSLVVLKNPEAVLQLLFYSCQLSNEDEMGAIAHRCFRDHLAYKDELKGNLKKKSVTYVEHLDTVALASDGCLDDLGLSTRARLCLRAAGEFEKQKEKNLEKVVRKLGEFEKEMKNLEQYREYWKNSGKYYYDAFKLQDFKRDFEANLSRLVLAGIWDEITDLLKAYDLPDEFEATKEWIDHGTRFRLLVEPLDIANYYRHGKGNDTVMYMKSGVRPKRYRFTQRWLEHRDNVLPGTYGESCFMADVEELVPQAGTREGVNKVRGKIVEMQEKVKEWINAKKVKDDVLSEGSTFVKLTVKIAT